jgi:hypothetical protein
LVISFAGSQVICSLLCVKTDFLRLSEANTLSRSFHSDLTSRASSQVTSPAVSPIHWLRTMASYSVDRGTLESPVSVTFPPIQGRVVRYLVGGTLESLNPLFAFIADRGSSTGESGKCVPTFSGVIQCGTFCHSPPLLEVGGVRLNPLYVFNADRDPVAGQWSLAFLRDSVAGQWRLVLSFCELVIQNSGDPGVRAISSSSSSRSRIGKSPGTQYTVLPPSADVEWIIP